MQVNIALLTVTDTRTIGTDKSGAILVKKIKEQNHKLIDRKLVKDEKEEIFIIGGAEIYKHAIPIANYLYFTRVHAWIKGDKEFPVIGPEWEEITREGHPVDAEHKMACTFFTYKKADRLHL